MSTLSDSGFLRTLVVAIKKAQHEILDTSTCKHIDYDTDVFTKQVDNCCNVSTNASCVDCDVLE